MRFTLRRLLVLLRVVKLGFRLRRDASAADSEDGPDGAPARILSARLTPPPMTMPLVLSGVELGSNLLGLPSDVVLC